MLCHKLINYYAFTIMWGLFHYDTMMCCVLCTVYCVLCACVLYALCCVLCSVFCALYACTVSFELCPVCCIPCAVFYGVC